MFALIAALVFLLALLDVGGKSIDLPVLGLFFLALHHIVGEWSPWRR